MTASHLAPAEATEGLLDLFRRMLEIRFFEDEVMRLFTQNLVRGSTHLNQRSEEHTSELQSQLPIAEAD